MRTIYKYPLWSPAWEAVDKVTLTLPVGAVVLTAADHGGAPTLWVEVDTDAPEGEGRTFEVFGTGHPMYQDMGVVRCYVGTCFDAPRGLVWHVYERLS